MTWVAGLAHSQLPFSRLSLFPHSSEVCIRAWNYFHHPWGCHWTYLLLKLTFIARSEYICVTMVCETFRQWVPALPLKWVAEWVAEHFLNELSKNIHAKIASQQRFREGMTETISVLILGSGARNLRRPRIPLPLELIRWSQRGLFKSERLFCWNIHAGIFLQAKVTPWGKPYWR